MGRSAQTAGSSGPNTTRLGRTTLRFGLHHAEELSMNAANVTAEVIPFAEYGETVLAGQVFDAPVAVDLPPWLDGHLAEVTQVPHGRKGLWGALARCSMAKATTWSEPTDVAALGPVLRPMFEIDPLLSVDLSVA